MKASSKQADPERYERAARARLARLGFDGERRNFLCIAPLVRDAGVEYRRAVLELDWALERGAVEAPLRALKGKALLFLGHHEDARAELDRSLRLAPDDARALAWRAEAALLRGAPADALADLEASRRLDSGYRWSAFFFAAALLASGDAEAALALLRGSEGAAESVLGAVAEARAGRPAEGVRRLEAFRRGWPLAFRGLLRAEAGDLDGAAADLTRAWRDEKLEWILERRCGVLERAGRMAEAVADATLLVRSDPRSAQARGRRARLWFQRRRHPEALADLAAAERLAPGEPRWKTDRADVLFLLGRMEEAHAAFLGARGAGGPKVEERLALTGALLGRRAEPAPALSASASSFWKGWAELRAGRFASAVRLFGSSASLEEREERRRRANLYAMTARVLDAAPRRGRPAGPELRLCSLGLSHPYTATAEVIGALAGCDVVFNNVAGPETAEWLWALAPRCRPATYDAANDEPRWADRIFEELKKGRVVGFATRGHAQVLGGLAYELIRRCRKKDVPVRAYGGVSCLDALPCTVDGWPSEPARLSALDARAVEEGAAFEPLAPLLLFFYEGADRVRLEKLSAKLSAAYGPSRPCLLFGPKYDDPPRNVAAGELAQAGAPFHSSLILYVPGAAPGRR